MNRPNIPYNTALKKLTIPEYGRAIQDMLDICMGLSNRIERLKCAEYIISLMARKSGVKTDDIENVKVLWDHLYAMSDFKLDIDFPVEVRSEEEAKFNPDKIPYHYNLPRYRHYGHGIEKMIQISMATEDPDLRKQRECITAIQMKKAYVTWNKGEVQNEKIFKDLHEMSDGKIYLDEFDCLLPDVSPMPVSDKHKQKKKSKQQRK